MTRSIYIFSIVVASSVVGLAQGELFLKLNSDEFTEREKAQEELQVWARDKKADAIEPLLQEYKKSDSPETRSRIEAVLREQVILKKFGSGPGFVGIRMQDGKVPLGGELVSAVGVAEIVKDSSAEKAGLKMGDQITAVDKVKFNDDNLGRVTPSLVFSNYVRTKTANDEVILQLVRNGKEMEIKVILMAIPDEVRKRQQELNLQEVGPSQAEKDRYFQQWLLQELKK